MNIYWSRFLEALMISTIIGCALASIICGYLIYNLKKDNKEFMTELNAIKGILGDTIQRKEFVEGRETLERRLNALDQRIDSKSFLLDNAQEVNATLSRQLVDLETYVSMIIPDDETGGMKTAVPSPSLDDTSLSEDVFQVKEIQWDEEMELFR